MLRMGSLLIEDQMFEGATMLKPMYFWDDVMNSVLGLPRLEVNDPGSRYELPALLKT